MNFTWIIVKPQQMGGVPCIRGLRIPGQIYSFFHPSNQRKLPVTI
jgi:hypothetical protein